MVRIVSFGRCVQDIDSFLDKSTKNIVMLELLPLGVRIFVSVLLTQTTFRQQPPVFFDNQN